MDGGASAGAARASDAPRFNGSFTVCDTVVMVMAPSKCTHSHACVVTCMARLRTLLVQIRHDRRS